MIRTASAGLLASAASAIIVACATNSLPATPAVVPLCRIEEGEHRLISLEADDAAFHYVQLADGGLVQCREIEHRREFPRDLGILDAPGPQAAEPAEHGTQGR